MNNNIMDDIKAKRIHECIKHRVNFISGTVTPCQSNKKEHSVKKQISDIESLDIGIKFLYSMYEKHVKDLTLSIQPKFMGSRINMYLFKKDHLSKSYCVTRNGFLCHLPKEKINPVIDSTYNRLKQFMEDNKIDMMILDGELLPWSALGKGLIENDFLPVDIGLKTEIELMEKYDFDNEMLKLKLRMQKIHDIYIVDKKKAIEEFGETLVKDYVKQYETINLINTSDVSRKLYERYHKQMELYGTVSDSATCEATYKLTYKPFGILKICFEDASESIPLIDHTYSQSKMYQLLVDPDSPDDQQIVITINTETINDDIEKIREHFNTLTYEKGYEGIVIKPDFVISDCLPMMKCRNTEYLSIIYGYDYMIEPKLTRLINNKSTARKIKQSINEFNAGMEMLKIKYSEIQKSDEYQKIIVKYLYNEENGELIDPRL